MSAAGICFPATTGRIARFGDLAALKNGCLLILRKPRPSMSSITINRLSDLKLLTPAAIAALVSIAHGDIVRIR